MKLGLSEESIKKSVSMLSIALADEMTLYVKTRKFHWNVSGPSFMELHKLFEAQYTQLEAVIDEIAERINKFDSKTIGTMEEFGRVTRLKEAPGKYPSQKEMIQELLADHETIIVELRKDIDVDSDAGTTDFFTKLLQDHETIAWTLRRYLN
ncbi:Dps family protein [Cytophaga hutchinsonii]|uniref:Starvation-inducible DNA-binding protein n=1 Tax=Cytophaga hutchinsonii (strain ATCC 33406 / DSM 1761 / CIP 103989 / NBRC 15051 / NCIMB 9469 / D465) TaxID=269798 RepID=A0A6N4SSJ9_CYTH3|nr:DNA starvation/stationary phase protection protein [Cytophaga hutchinsonii]ABG59339.1 starvation-inducible DNA-binding protein [Cytophaga hutchinsonii ATCC 33406]SFX92081.1 starvation-inducible DNA-binding protein [Cytophaga hutchinsonii ATCC 33406]